MVATTVRFPARRPVSFSTDDSKHAIRDRQIRTADGIEGIGYTYGGMLVAKPIGIISPIFSQADQRDPGPLADHVWKFC